MKTFKFLFLTALIFSITYSCSSESISNGNENDELANQQNETENRNIRISEIESGIIIEGSSTVSGTPPAPSGILNFQIETSNQEAFQTAGFNIKFSSTNAIKGAYILFGDTDGTKSSSYFNVPIEAISTGKFSRKKTNANEPKKSRKLSTSKSFVEIDYLIDVDFNNIAPGNFCYEICLYDNNGNISSIETICVTVEAWGGNSSIVGEWVFDRYEPEDNNSEIFNIVCNNGQNIDVEYTIYEQEDWTFALNADGTYYEVYNDIYKYIDYDATQSSCSTIYGESIIYNQKFSGNWAYNEDNATLTVIDFNFEDLIDNSNNETYETGEVYFEGVKVEIISNELVLTDTYVEAGEQYTSIFIFKKK
jgi:hypothetical protein